MAAATVVIALGQAFADAGLTNAVIARKSTSEELSTLYCASLLAGAAVFGLMLLLTPSVVAFYNEPRLAAVLRWGAAIFLIAPIGQLFNSLYDRALEFRLLALIHTTAALTGTVVAVMSAYLGGGVLSLVWGMLASTIMSSAILFIMGRRRWQPRLRLKWTELRRFVDFGLYQMGERSINYAAANVDYMIIGRALGAAALGSYSVAYQMVIKPLVYINPILSRVAFPVFALKQDDNLSLERGYLHVIRLLALVTFPLLVALAVLAPEFVLLVLGEQWETTIPLLQILCGVGMLKSITNPVGSLLLAKDRPDIGFKGNALLLVIMTGALLTVASDGPIAIAWTYLAVTFVATGSWVLVLRWLIGLSLTEYVRTLRMPILLTLTVGAGMVIVRELVDPVMQSPWFVLLLVGGFGGVFYLSLLALFQRAYIRSLWQLFRSGSPAGEGKVSST